VRRALTAAALGLPLLGQAAVSTAVPDQSVSVIALPLTVDLAKFLPMVEAQVPKVPPMVEQWTEIAGKPRTYFRTNLYREPLVWRFRDQQVKVSTVLNFGMDIGVRTVGQHFTVMGSCGRAPEPPRRALVTFETGWELLPDWTLALKDPKATAEALNPCQITFLGIDITDEVTAGMQAQIRAGVDQLGALVKQNALIKQKAQEAWTLACQPVELRKDAWLMLRPERLRLGPMKTSGNRVTVTPELQARPLLVIGGPPAAASTPLPPLETALSVDPGFHIRAEAHMDYAALSLQMTEAMGGKPFDTERGKITVNTVAVTPKSGKLQLELDLSGAFTGLVTLEGRPVITLDGQVAFQDLDFAVDKAGWMVKAGTWLFKSKILRTLQEKSAGLIAQQFQDLKSLANSQLTRELAPGVTLEGALDAFRLERMEVDAETLRIVSRVDGQLRLQVR
jgi:hypothetical protein